MTNKERIPNIIRSRFESGINRRVSLYMKDPVLEETIPMIELVRAGLMAEIPQRNVTIDES